MPDGALNLTVSDDTAQRLAERAQALGLTPEALAAQMLGQLLDDPVLSERPATRPEDFDGPYIELDDALMAFDAELERRLAARAR